jgi:hypothetical protein
MTSDYQVRDTQAEKALELVGRAIRERLPKGYGFSLLLFQFHGKNMFYTGNADRMDVIEAMKEFIRMHEKNSIVDGVNRKEGNANARTDKR